MISADNGWKIVVALLGILCALVGLVWSTHVTTSTKTFEATAKKIEQIERRDNELDRAVTEIKTHLEHYEVTQQEIKQDVKTILDKVD